MTSPPAHLLPLALLACEDLDACEVLEDALLESEWSEWTRVARLFWVDGDVRNWEAYVVERASFPARTLTRTTARAIAAVLLFGEWSTTRWPLVEVHEVLSSGPFLAHIERLKGMLDDNMITVDQFRELVDMTMRAEGLWGEAPRRRGGR